MMPTLPEIIVLTIICVAIFGLGKLDKLGELAWRIRCRLTPSLDAADDSAGRDRTPPNSKE